MGPVEPQGRLWQVRARHRQMERDQGSQDFPGRQVLRPLRQPRELLQQGQDPCRSIHSSASAENRLRRWLR